MIEPFFSSPKSKLENSSSDGKAEVELGATISVLGSIASSSLNSVMGLSGPSAVEFVEAVDPPLRRLQAEEEI